MLLRVLMPIVACAAGCSSRSPDAVLFFGVLAVVYAAVGVTESVMARYRMDKVPQFVLTSFALVFFATIISLEFLQ